MINFEALRNAQSVSVLYPDINISAEDIRKFREKTSLSQTALANMLHVSVKDVIKWESGKKKITGAASVLLYLLIQKPEIKDELRNILVTSTAEMK